MTQLQEKAIARSADHENLVGELVGACEWLLNCMSLAGWESDAAAINARAVIAKAKAEAQQ